MNTCHHLLMITTFTHIKQSMYKHIKYKNKICYESLHMHGNWKTMNNIIAATTTIGVP